MKCEICGKEITQSDYSNATLCSKECYNAHYWLTKYKEYMAKDSAIIVYKGVCYTLGSTNDAKKGNYGKMYKITPHQRLDPYMTNNLWANGTIPKAFRELMPDNILFMEALN